MRRLALSTLILAAACSSFSGDSGETPDGGDPLVDAGPTMGADGAPTITPDAASSSAYAAAVLEDKPLAYWRMNSTTGISVDDVTGNGHTMILTGGGILVDAGAATSDDGDHAVSFDGKSAYAFVPDSGAFDFPTLHAFSIECWVKPAPLEDKDASPPVFHHIFTRALTNGVRRGYFAYIPQAEEKILGVRATATGVATQSYGGGPVMFDGKFHHVVAVMKPGAKWSVYIDGQEHKSTDTIGTAEPIDANFALAIDLPDMKNYFGGVIDEVAIYDHALEDLRIVTHFAKGRP